MIQGFAKIDGITHLCEMSEDTYERVRAWCLENKKKIGDFIKAAWKKYGVSEKALTRFLEEKAKE